MLFKYKDIEDVVVRGLATERIIKRIYDETGLIKSLCAWADLKGDDDTD